MFLAIIRHESYSALRDALLPLISFVTFGNLCFLHISFSSDSQSIFIMDWQNFTAMLTVSDIAMSDRFNIKNKLCSLLIYVFDRRKTLSFTQYVY